jgi:Ser/Thr protein kinase RdoA (MazF antagonist)
VTAGTETPDAFDALGDHLARRYGIEPTALIELDVDVVRVDRADGPSWVARIFPRERPLEAVAGDASILAALERAGFPAERCAARDSVSSLDGRGVLVTGFVDGTPSRGGRRAFVVLAELLGRLHAATAERSTTMRTGGGWHHMTPQGGPTDELAATRARLEAARARASTYDSGAVDALCAEVERVDDCAGLPQALVHPDFVPANAVLTPEQRLVVVDWTGAGRAARLWSLAFLLWAAAARDLDLVDPVVARYVRHIRLGPDELERLAGAICARPLVIDCWSYCEGRARLADVVDRMTSRRDLAPAVAAKVAAAAESAA